MLGAEYPRTDYEGEECKIVDNKFSSDWHHTRASLALENVRWLKANSENIYGIRNRFSQNYHNLKLTTLELYQWIFSVTTSENEHPSAWHALIGAAFREHSLLYYASSGLQMNLCIVQTMVPDSNSDSQTEALRKLNSLESLLLKNHSP